MLTSSKEHLCGRICKPTVGDACRILVGSLHVWGMTDFVKVVYGKGTLQVWLVWALTGNRSSSSPMDFPFVGCTPTFSRDRLELTADFTRKVGLNCFKPEQQREPSSLRSCLVGAYKNYDFLFPFCSPVKCSDPPIHDMAMVRTAQLSVVGAS